MQEFIVSNKLLVFEDGSVSPLRTTRIEATGGATAAGGGAAAGGGGATGGVSATGGVGATGGGGTTGGAATDGAAQAFRAGNTSSAKEGEI